MYSITFFALYLQAVEAEEDEPEGAQAPAQAQAQEEEEEVQVPSDLSMDEQMKLDYAAGRCEEGEALLGVPATRPRKDHSSQLRNNTEKMNT